MKYILFILCLFISNPSLASSKVKKSQEISWNSLIKAIIYVESRGQRFAKNGKSIGVMQITPIMVDECNRILKRRNSKSRYKLIDRYSAVKSKEMFFLIQSVYNPRNDAEHAIRLWNGGPHYKKKHTQRYYERVMRAMK